MEGCLKVSSLRGVDGVSEFGFVIVAVEGF